MIRRARLLVIVGFLLAGAIGVISSTQPWLLVQFSDGAQQDLAVPGASAIALLAPLSLTALALGGALSIAGVVLRVILGSLGLLVGAVLVMLTGQVVLTVPISAIAGEVAAATGISGEAAVAGLVSAVTLTAWPWIAVVAALVLVGASVTAIVTARQWADAGRRYRADTRPARAQTGPLDAIDSWDDLSRGQDPTS